MAFTHSVCLRVRLTSLFSVKLYLALSLISLSALPLELRMNDVSFTIFFWLRMLACVSCVCAMSPAWPCLSETEPCCQCVVCVCLARKREMRRWSCEASSTPPPPTLSNQNETLNTSQSVKRAAKIETDPLFHYYTSKLILLTTCGIRSDKWLQIRK